MKKNTSQLVAIIALICCTIALLTCGVLVACKGMDDTPAKNSSVQDDDGEWTQNY